MLGRIKKIFRKKLTDEEKEKLIWDFEEKLNNYLKYEAKGLFKDIKDDVRVSLHSDYDAIAYNYNYILKLTLTVPNNSPDNELSELEKRVNGLIWDIRRVCVYNDFAPVGEHQVMNDISTEINTIVRKAIEDELEEKNM